MAKSILFTFLFLSANLFCMGQDGPVKVRVFDGTTPEEETTAKKSIFNDKNLLSINPYLLARGVFTVGYERALHQNHTMLIDIGLTYRDFIYEFSTSDEFLFGEENVKVGIGKFVQVAYKFYPKGTDDFDGGFYLSPALIFRDYKLTETVTYLNGTINESVDLDRNYKMNEYALKFGYCVESWWFDDLIADVYFGVGSRQITRKEYDEAQNYKLIGELPERKPALYFGVKIGVVF
jgi:hypothetical protein